MSARDWRGAPIEPGATVIYGAPVGRSIALVEGIVADPMFTPGGRIWVQVVRRAHGGGWIDGADRVHVGPDRLTVITALPPSTAPTEAQLREQARANIAERAAHYDTHRIADHDTRWDDRYCPVCGVRGVSRLSDGPCSEGM